MKTEILNQITSLGLERTFLNLKMTEANSKMKMKSSTVANYSDERYHRERKCDIDSGIEDDQYHKNCIHQACHVPCLIYKHPIRVYIKPIIGLNILIFQLFHCLVIKSRLG